MTGAAILLVLLASPGAAAPGALGRAVEGEMRRTLARLQMPGRVKPYFLSYRIDETTGVYMTASFGGLRRFPVERRRSVSIDLRVGSRAFDQTHYVSKGEWDYRPLAADLPIDDDEDALRFELWSLTDRAYKKALEKLAQKTAYRDEHDIRDVPPDLSDDPVAVSTHAARAEVLDLPAWEERARRLSMIFRKHPRIQDSWVNMNWTTGTRYFLDSEGRSGDRPLDLYEIVINAAAQGPDGLPIFGRRRFFYRRLSDIPGDGELSAATEALARGLVEAVDAPLMDSYWGPVLFQGQASAEFFNQLFVRNVSSPRSLWIEDKRMEKYYPSGGLASRLGLRAVSPLLDIEDDPGLAVWNGEPLVGGYEVDDEGLSARKVALVQKGLLRDLLMSRSPIKERSNSNGRGRAERSEVVVSRPSNLIVHADSTVSSQELESLLRRQAGALGLRYGLLIPRLGEEWAQEENDVLAEPVIAYKVYVDDGRKEPIRGAAFANVTLRALRDVTAASAEVAVYNYPQAGPYRYSRGYVPASIVCPSVLISEMELKKTERKPMRLPYLAHPFFER